MMRNLFQVCYLSLLIAAPVIGATAVATSSSKEQDVDDLNSTNNLRRTPTSSSSSRNLQVSEGLAYWPTNSIVELIPRIGGRLQANHDEQGLRPATLRNNRDPQNGVPLDTQLWTLVQTPCKEHQGSTCYVIHNNYRLIKYYTYILSSDQTSVAHINNVGLDDYSKGNPVSSVPSDSLWRFRHRDTDRGVARFEIQNDRYDNRHIGVFGGTNIVADNALQWYVDAVAHDECNDALEIRPGQRIFGTTVTSTPDADFFGFGPSAVPTSSVWYRFTGNGRLLHLNMNCQLEKEWDSVIQIVGSTSCSQYSGNHGTYSGGSDMCRNNRAVPGIQTVHGENYWIRVSGYNVGDTGSFELSLVEDDQPEIYCDAQYEGGQPCNEETFHNCRLLRNVCKTPSSEGGGGRGSCNGPLLPVYQEMECSFGRVSLYAINQECNSQCN